MNKKGEEGGAGVGNTIKVVIAVFVLIIVILGIYIWFSGKGIPFFQYLPSFNQTKPGVVDNELFKYAIASDKLQYYDSNNWIDFKPGTTVEANGKKIAYNQLKDDMVYSTFIGQSKTFGTILAQVWPVVYKVVVPAWWERSLNFWKTLNPSLAVAIPGGNIRLQVSGDSRLFYLQQNSTLYEGTGTDIPELKKADMTKVPDVLKSESLRKEILAWRDSLLDKSVTVHYSNSPAVETCFIQEYYDINKDLVVDLSRSLEAGKKCPYLTYLT